MKVLTNFVSVGNIIVSLCFILALRGLSTQISAKMGNIYGIIGMCVAFITAIISKCYDFLNAPTSSDALDRNEILYLLIGYLSCLIPAACI
ncbi:NAD(P)(+) transhydrogenase (AB-specific), alpha subunit, putative, partial [Entamoeba nuttalli P19]